MIGWSVKNQACGRQGPDLETGMMIPTDTVHYGPAACKGAVETQLIPACSWRQLNINFCLVIHEIVTLGSFAAKLVGVVRSRPV